MTAYQKILKEAQPLRKKYQIVAIALQPYRLTVSSWLLLGLVHDQQPIVSPSSLARQIGAQPAYVSRLLADMSKRGLVTIEQNIQDRRGKHIVYTGGELLNEIERKLRGKV